MKCVGRTPNTSAKQHHLSFLNNRERHASRFVAHYVKHYSSVRGTFCGAPSEYLCTVTFWGRVKSELMVRICITS